MKNQISTAPLASHSLTVKLSSFKRYSQYNNGRRAVLLISLLLLYPLYNVLLLAILELTLYTNHPVKNLLLSIGSNCGD